MATRSKLAVIVHADIVGSTTLVQRDERIAHERVQSAFRRLSDVVSHYGGRTQELRGDALVAEFDRASDAVSAGLAFQAGNERANAQLDGNIRPEVRIGIALGEVVIADHTLTGAGVVLAQRLEQLASPGGVCISGAVHEALPARLTFEYVPLGVQTLKGFDEAVQAFSVRLRAQTHAPPPETRPRPWRRRNGRWIALVAVLLVSSVAAWFKPWQARIEPADVRNMVHPLPDKPSVAVLPFRNLSNAKVQEYFSDAVTEQVITDLSKLSGLFVVANESSATYRDKPVKLSQVAEELGVRYLLEGSVQRDNARLRVTVTLVDAVKGIDLWSERYDRQLTDLFAVQSEVASKVAKALSVTLSANEAERVLQKYTTSIDAYDIYLKARRAVDAPSRENVERGEALFQQVIKLDPEFAGGYAGLSYTYNIRARFRYGSDPKAYRAKALELAKKAVEVDPTFGWSYIALGGAYLANRDSLAAVDAARKALILEPNGYFPNLYLGFYLQFAGESALAVEHLERATRISPLGSFRNYAFLGRAYLLNGDYQKAADVWAKRYREYPNSSPNGFVYAAAAFHLAGDSASAAAIVEKLRSAFPDFRLSKWGYIKLYRLERDRKLLYEAAKEAGIPE